MKTVAFLFCLFVVGAGIGHVAGCKSPGAAAAESAYTLDLLRCVDNATTLAESHACRGKVDAQWSITETEAGAK